MEISQQLNNLKKWMQKKPIASATITFVIFTHFVILYFLPKDKLLLLVAKAPQNVTVRTVELQPKKKIVTEKAKAKPVKKQKAKPKPKSKKKRVQHKKKKKRINQEEEELLQALKKDMESFKSEIDIQQSELEAVQSRPQKIKSLNIESSINTEIYDTNYYTAMIDRLRNLLRLPEYGSVKIGLEIDRKGYVSSIEIVSSESKVNESYIKEMIPNISFPNFGTAFEGQEKRRFLITLSNDL
jgi:hypothetical protein